MELELVQKFKDIFTGLERAHGVFEKKNEPQEGVKVEAHMKTVHEPPSIEKFKLSVFKLKLFVFKLISPVLGSF